MMAAEVVLPAVRPCNESQPGTDPAEGKKRYIFQPSGLSHCVLGQGKLQDQVLRLRGAQADPSTKEMHRNPS